MMDGGQTTTQQAPQATPAVPAAQAPQSTPAASEPARAEAKPDNGGRPHVEKLRDRIEKAKSKALKATPDPEVTEARADDADEVKAPAEKKPEPVAPALDAAKPETWPEPLRQQFEQVHKAHAAVTKENGEWRDAGQQVLQQNRSLLERVQFLQTQLESAGVQIDPRDAELLEHRTAKATQEWSAKAIQAQQTKAQEARITAEVQNLRNEVTQAAKAAGLDGEDLLADYAWQAKKAMGKGQTPPTIADVIANQKAILAAKQQQANGAAPGLVTKTQAAPSGTVVKFGRTTHELQKMLQSRGHEID